MGRREGRFPGAPSRAGREGKRSKTERVASSALPPVPATSPAIEAAKGVERGIRAFNNLVGEEEKEEEFHGFTDLDVSAASEKADVLRKEGDLLKHDLAEARAHKFGSSPVQWTYCKGQKKAAAACSKRKRGTLSIVEAKRRSIERRYSTEKQSKSPSPKKKKEIKIIPQITVIEIPENLQPKKQKSEIQIPSWRQVSLRGLINGIKREELEEDLSDSAFERRHQKAEEEEQMLWEKWTEMREAEGKAEGGRSKSSRWREVEHHIFTPRLRSQRLSSLLSEASSTPGRLSPTTMSMVHEICIEPVILPSPTPAPSSTPKSQKSPKSPTPAPPASTPKSQGEKKRRPEQMTLMSVLNEVIKEEDQNLRRVRGEIRRSSASSQQQAAKENMGKGASSSEEQKGRGGQGESRTSSSTSAGSRVLKDSNLVLAKAQLSRPTMKKMSNNGVPQKEYKLYPLRSQSLSRRTRRGSRR